MLYFDFTALPNKYIGLSSTNDKLSKSQVLCIYVGFFKHSCVYTLVHFTEVAYINLFGNKIINLIILIHPPLSIISNKSSR